MDIHNSQFGADIEFKTLDIGTPAWAVKPGPDAIPAIPAVPGTTDASEDFEGTLWTQITEDSGDWTLETDQAHSPTHSYKSKDINANESTSFTIQNNSFQEQISFWLRTDTEEGFDLFRVFIDAVEVYSISGDNDWFRVALPTGFGYLVEFRYSKDSSGSTPDDACWVDDLVFGTADIPEVPGSPAHPFVYAPLTTNAEGELLVSGCSCSTSDTASTPVQVSQDTSADLILSANPLRKGFTIQNTGTTIIKLSLGATNPTQTAYHIALSACSVADDGLGGYYSDDTFIGDVRAISSAGGGTLVYLEVS